MTTSLQVYSPAALIIDASIRDKETLINAYTPRHYVLQVPSHANGLDLITAFLRRKPWVTSLTIVAHGAPGCLTLGATHLSLETLPRFSAQLKQWIPRISEKVASHIYLYSCELGAGIIGQRFLGALRDITDATIHASSQMMGGGTWELDIKLPSTYQRTALTTTANTIKPLQKKEIEKHSNINSTSPFNLDRLKDYAFTLASDFTVPPTASGLEDTVIPLNISVDPGLISGGSQLDVIDTAAGFYDASVATATTFTIPTGATSIRITGLGGNNDGSVNADNEDYQTTSLVVDLNSGTYSGHLFHVLGQSSQTNDNYAFSDITLGSASNSGAIVGDNDDNLNSITVAVTGNTLSIAETQTRLDQAYLVEYLTADGSSTNFIKTLSDVQNVNDAISTLSLPGESNLIVLSVQDGRGGLGFIHEDKGIGRIIIDRDTGLASGTIFSQTGSGENESSAYSFVGYDINSEVSILNSSATITGDTTSNATTLPDLKLSINNNDLTVTRTAASAQAYTSLISAQAYERLNVGSSAVSLGTSEVSGEYIDNPNQPNIYDLELPGSAQTGTLTLALSNILGGSATNENSGLAQIFVDLENETTSGSFLMLRTTNPDLVSWTDVPFRNRLIDHPNTVSNRSSINQFQDEIAGVLSFDVVTRADGSKVLRITANSVAGNGTTGFRNYDLTWQAQWAGRLPITVTGLPSAGSLNAGAFDPATGSWLISPTDLANLAYIPPQHFSGEKVPVDITFNGSTQTVDIDVIRVADAPTLSTQDQAGDEDTVIDISSAITAALVDSDGSETISLIELSSIPIGHTISDGTNSFTASTGNQFVDILNWDLTALSYQAPLHVNGTFSIDVSVQTSDEDGFSSTPDIATTTDSFIVDINPVNDDPTANDNEDSTDEDTLLSINLTSNDTDPDIADDLSIQSLDTTGTLGLATIDPGSDSVTYDPRGTFDYLAVGETATDTLRYTITDGNGGTDTATTTVIISGVNDAPTALDDTATTDEDSPISVNLTTNDTDPDLSDDLRINNLNTSTTLGIVTVNPDSDSVTYNPNGEFEQLALGESATDTFSYTVTDGMGGTSTATVSIVIAGVNDAPLALDDQDTTDEDNSVSINLTANDTDSDISDNLDITSIDTSGTLGLVTINPDNDSVTYDPNGQFDSLAVGSTATDTFTYTLTDGNGGTDTATVVVTINSLNDTPSANDDIESTNEDTTTSINLTGNDSDPDLADNLEIDSIDTTGTIGTVTINPDNDSVTYDPNGLFEFLAIGETATDTFLYQVTDGKGGTDTAAVTVTIQGANDAPTAIDDFDSTDEDSAISLDLTADDTDPDVSDNLAIFSIDTTGTLGTVSINSDNESVTYNPSGSFEFLAVGETITDTFSYTITDQNGGQDTAIATIVISGVNDEPTAVEDKTSTTEDSSIALILTNNDTDPDLSDDLEIDFLDTTDTLGAVTLNPDLDSVTYDPNGLFEGLAVGQTATDTFTYTIVDAFGGTDSAIATITITGVNDAPTPIDDARTISENNTSANILLTGNDLDVDSTDDLEIRSIDTSGAVGLISINPDSDSISYNTNSQFDALAVGETATDTFSYTVTDNNGASSTANVTITINGINDDPVAVDDAANTSEENALSIDLTLNDTDLDTSDDLEIRSVDTTNTIGTVTVNADDDTVIYDPNNAFESLAVGESTTDTFTYTVTDSHGATSTATVTVTINGLNDLPIAINDVSSTTEGNSVSIDLTGNDTDPDLSDDLSISTIDTTMTVGTVSLNPDNDSVTYDPNGQFQGLAVGETAIDTFTYTVTDSNGETSTATVTITIDGVNDLPIAVDDTETTDEDTSVTVDLTSNDTDADISDDLEIASIDTAGILGSVSVNGDNDTVIYDPNGAFEGLVVGETAIDTFTYTVTDGNGVTDTATVSISITGVNDEPVAIDDVTSTTEDNSVAIILTGNDTDPDISDDLEIASIDTSGILGSVSVNGDNDTVTYDPNGAFEQLAVGESTIDTFSYTVTDGNGGSDTATVDVTIFGVNDTPTAVDDTGSTDEDSSISIDLTANDTDPDTSDDLEITAIDTSSTLGIVNVNPDNDSVTYDPNGIFESLAVGETATDTFTYGVTDGQGASDTATVVVTITGVNDLPTASDDLASTNADTDISIGLTVNDTDPDVTDDLEISAIDTSAMLGVVTVNGDGDSVTYDPNGAFESLALGETATDTFLYTVSDGQGGTDTATVSVIISGVNDAPTANNDVATTDEDSSVSFSLTANDTDPDLSDDLEIDTIISNTTLGSVSVNPDNDTVIYDPNGAFEYLAVGETATDTFTYSVIDGSGGSDTATVVVTINGVNDAPTAENDASTTDEDTAVSLNLITNDIDPDVSDTLKIDSVDTSETIGLVSINPDNLSVTYDPNGTFNGLAVGETATDSFTYIVTDGNGGTDTATVTITINSLNDTPTAVNDTGNTDENNSVSVNLTTNDTDPDLSDDLEIVSIDSAALLGVASIDAGNDSITYDPNGAFDGLAAGESATESFTYIVTDGEGGTDTATVVITIDGVNDLPTANDDLASTDEDSLVSLNLTVNDTDPDISDDLEIASIDISSTLGAVSVNADNDSVTYDPNGAFESLAIGETATDTFTYIVTDGNGASDTASVVVIIDGVNDTPTAVNDTATTDQDSSVTIDLTANDIDPDLSDDLEINIVDSATTLGVVTINPDNDTISYDPNGAFDGLALGESATDSFSYVVSDGAGGTDTATVVVTINGVNNLPNAIDDVATTDEDSAVSFNLSSNDTDIDVSDVLQVTAIDLSTTLGFASINPDNQSVTYDPNGTFETLAIGETATDSFSYTISDGNGGIDTAIATILITGRNDAPTAIGDTQSISEDDTATPITLTGNDLDIDGTDDLEILSIDTLSSVGLITINPDLDSVIYNTNGQFDGLAVGETATDTFSYTITDGNGETSSATVTITINGVNDAPTAINAQASTSEDTFVSIDLTSNDTDPDISDDLEILSIDTTGILGSVLLNGDNDTVIYDPNGAFEQLAVGESATDTFSYTVTDSNGGSDTATVNVTILGINDAAMAVDDTGATDEDSSISINLTVNDTDLDASDDLEISSIDTTQTLGLVNIDVDNDSVIYDPNGAFESLAVGETATDSFSYVVTDGQGASDTATVVVTITGANDLPIAIDDLATTNADTTISIDLTGNDIDPDDTDDLEISTLDTSTTFGNVIINGDADSVTYDPNGAFESLALGEIATDSFTYTVSDGQGGTDTATVSVIISGVNNLPTANDDLASTDEETSVSFSLTANDTDPDVSDDLAIHSIDTTATLGSVSVNTGDDEITYTPNGAFESLAVGETATDTFTYVTTDGNGGTDTASVIINISGVNDQPTANDDSASTNETNAISINITTNDSDPDLSDDLEILSIDVIGTSGLATVASDGDSILYNPNGAFAFLAVGQTATDTLQYVVTDGNGGTDTATVTIEIIGENDTPTAIDDTRIVAENAALANINLTGNDIDPDAADDLEILSIDIANTLGQVSINPSNDSVTYRPNGQFESLAVGETATDTFSYTISDGNGSTDVATVTVTILGQNDRPTANNDARTVAENAALANINLTGNDTDLDISNDLEILSIDTANTLGLVSINPSEDSVAYRPNGQFESLSLGETATDTFSYVTSDGDGGTDTAIVTVTILGQNDRPTASNDVRAVAENATLANINLTVNDTDPDTVDDLEILSIDTNNTVGQVSINPSDDSVAYRPNGQFESLAAGETATDTFSYVITDGNGSTDTATVSVTIIGQNDRPTANNDTRSIAENATLANINLTANDTDPDTLDDLEILAIDTSNTLGQASINPSDDSVAYRPNGQFEDLAFGETATDSFSYTITDGHGGTDTASVTVVIVGQNDPLTAVDDFKTVAENAAQANINLTGNDSDPDFSDDIRILSVDSSLTLGSVSIYSNLDRVIYSPNNQFDSLAAGETATDTFDYVVSDGNGSTATATATVQIVGRNNAPVAFDSSVDTFENTPVLIDALENDVDIDEDELIVIEAISLNGSVSIQPNGTLIYTSEPGFSGEDVITYTISDSNGGTSTASISVQVFPSDVFSGLGTQTPDLINGTSGNDVISGFSDEDTLFGGAGNDTISGGSSADTLSGGTGHDVLSGGTNNDLIIGSEGLDTLLGGSGDDTLDGGRASDTLIGSSGNDLLLGGFAVDNLNGGNGDDTLRGGLGADSLQGGQGQDVFAYQSVAEFRDVILDFAIVEDVIDLSGIYNGRGSFQQDIRLIQQGQHASIQANTGGSFNTIGVALNVNIDTIESRNFIF